MQTLQEKSALGDALPECDFKRKALDEISKFALAFRGSLEGHISLHDGNSPRRPAPSKGYPPSFCTSLRHDTAPSVTPHRNTPHDFRPPGRYVGGGSHRPRLSRCFS